MLKETELVKSRNGSELRNHFQQIGERKQEQKSSQGMVIMVTNRVTIPRIRRIPRINAGLLREMQEKRRAFKRNIKKKK